MPKTPGVVMDTKGGQVRLRGLKWALPVTLDTETKGRIKANIKPNTWTSVPEEVYHFLKGRFDSPRYTTIPDVEANERDPHAPGEAPIMKQEEVDPGFFLEFKDR